MNISSSYRFPLDVWVGILEHLDPRAGEIGESAALVDRSLAAACRSPALWNRLALRRTWRVDPEPFVAAARPSSGDGTPVDWRAVYRAVAAAEGAAMARLRDLASLKMESTLGRHFVGRPPHPVYSGWEDRFWSFERRTILAWESPSKRNCYAEFPIGKHCEVKVLTEEDFRALARGRANPLKESRPHCFTVTGTSFDIVWSCPDAEALRGWVDKLNVTIHAQRSEDASFLLNPKYKLDTETVLRGRGRERVDAAVPGPADIVSRDVA